MASITEISTNALLQDNFEETNSKHLVFPTDLNSNRYIVLDFYGDNTMQTVAEAVENIMNLAVSAVQNAKIPDVSEVVDPLVKGGGAIASSLSTAFKNRIITKEVKVDGEVTQAAVVGSYSSGNITKNEETYKGSIYLPLANNLKESMSHEYDKQTGVVGNVLGNIANTKIGGIASVQEAINGVGKLTGSRTLLTNPDYIQVYKGTGMRELSLTWTLMPKNKEEATAIFEIVRTMKEFSSPQLQTHDTLLVSPFFCAVTFNNAKLDDSVRFDEMMINKIDVNYSETGFMEAYSDGIPKSIVLDIGLLERRMKTSKDWVKERPGKSRLELADEGVFF